MHSSRYRKVRAKALKPGQQVDADGYAKAADATLKKIKEPCSP